MRLWAGTLFPLLLATIMCCLFAAPAHAETDCSNNFPKFLKLKNVKAFAVGENESRCYWRFGASSRKLAENAVMKDCRKRSKQCKLLNVYGEIARINKEVQTGLQALGLYDGSIDGKIGPASREAVKELQKIAGKTQDGVVDYEFRQLLAGYKNIANASAKDICGQATLLTLNNKREWAVSGQRKFYVNEANRRKLSLQSCARILGDETVVANKTRNTDTKDKAASDTSTKSFAGVSDRTICTLATWGRENSEKRFWNSSDIRKKHVDEAERRNLTLNECSLLVAGKSRFAKTETGTDSSAFTRFSDKSVCSLATVTAKSTGERIWSRIEVRQAHVDEAKRRGLDELECAKLLGGDILVASRDDVEKSEKQQANVKQQETEPPAKKPIELALSDYRSGKYDDALKKFEPLGHAENPEAQLHLGHIYALGQGVERDEKMARFWYARAKANGNALASVMLATLEPAPAARPQKVESGKTAQPDTPKAPANLPVLEKRLALVIGNSAYENSTPLPNPKNDAAVMTATLEELGFDVISGIDLDKNGMEATIRRFARKAPSYDLSLFFYAGHGMQVGRRNYLVPVDAKLDEETAVDFELLDVEQNVVKYMGGGTKTGIVLLDACRDNPLARRFARTFQRTRSGNVSTGLAEMENRGGLLFGFATAPGDVAADGEGTNSPFTTALVKHIVSPNTELQQIMTRVKRDVALSTGNRQRPWHNSDLTVEVYLSAKK